MAQGYTHQHALKQSRAAKRKQRLDKRKKNPNVKVAQKKRAARRERDKVLQKLDRASRRALRRKLGKAGACEALNEDK